MNTQNYASLEACQRLVDAGIVLETDFYWATYGEKACRSLRDAGKLVPKPYLVSSQSLPAVIIKNPTNSGYYPAASSAELWRELPDSTCVNKDGDHTKCWIDSKTSLKVFQSTNPTDALIDLLIFVRK